MNKKKITTKGYNHNNEAVSNVNESPIMYLPSPLSILKKKPSVQVITKEFTYKNFKKIFDKSNFTLEEWANFLFISERTLQRYAKSNAAFSGLYIERILLLENMIDAGNSVFGDAFVSWLKQPSIKYSGATPYNQLSTQAGIQNVINYIGQLEWGIFA
jgi:hypothetical protein